MDNVRNGLRIYSSCTTYYLTIMFIYFPQNLLIIHKQCEIIQNDARNKKYMVFYLRIAACVIFLNILFCFEDAEGI